MGALKKVKFTADWLNEDPKVNANARKVHKFEQVRVIKSEDLPELMTTKEAGVLLRRHPKTIEEYRKDGSLKFIKSRGRYFTTPEYIAEFLEAEAARK